VLRDDAEFLEFGQIGGEQEDLPLHPPAQSVQQPAEEEGDFEEVQAPATDQASVHSGDEEQGMPSSDEEEGEPEGQEEVNEEYQASSDEEEEKAAEGEEGFRGPNDEQEMDDGEPPETTCTKNQRYVSHLQDLRYRLARRRKKKVRVGLGGRNCK